MQNSIIQNGKSFFIIFFSFLFLLFSINVLAIDNCEDKITIDKIPCYVILPSNSNCSTINVSFYYNSTEFLENQLMSNYTSFQCSGIFNYTTLGTYSFYYTTGDSGNIVVEVGNMNVIIYGILLALVIIFLWLMHKTRDVEGSSFIYSGMAAIISYLMSSMLFFGFKFLDGITLIIDVNYYLALIMLAFGIYCTVVSYNLVLDYRERYKKEESFDY